MTRFLLEHHHTPTECSTAFAAFQGFDSPVRRQVTITTCRLGGHRIWWTVDASNTRDALAQLPEYVAVRTVATTVTDLRIP